MIQLAELSISNYHETIRKDRARYGGGVALYIHSSIFCKYRSNIIVREAEVLPADIKISNGKSMSVIAWYRPEGPVDIFDHVESTQRIRDVLLLEIPTVIFSVNFQIILQSI